MNEYQIMETITRIRRLAYDIDLILSIDKGILHGDYSDIEAAFLLASATETKKSLNRIIKAIEAIQPKEKAIIDGLRELKSKAKETAPEGIDLKNAIII